MHRVIEVVPQNLLPSDLLLAKGHAAELEFPQRSLSSPSFGDGPPGPSMDNLELLQVDVDGGMDYRCARERRRACVRACVRTCVRTYARACVRTCVLT